MLPGGFCTLLLADLGADVLKVEDTGGGDYIRWMPPYYGGEEEQRAGVASAYFLALNRNKRSLRLNLKDERGREVLLRLVEDYDVLVESFRPGVMDRLGVGYDVLRERNPRLIYCPISGYGQDGPLTARSGHDTNYLALNGLLGPHRPARRSPDPVRGADRRPRRRRADGGGRDPRRGDRARALRRGPDGRHLDDRRRAVLARDGGRAVLRRAAGAAARRARADRRHRLLLPVRDEGRRWVSLGALEPKFWQNWCAGVGRPDLVEKQFEHPDSEAGAEIAAVFRERTRDEWAAFAGEHDCCLEPILGLDEALDSELVRAREMVVELDQPASGRVKLLGAPIKLSRTPADTSGAAPALGADTDEVLREIGIDPQPLRDEGVV